MPKATDNSDMYTRAFPVGNALFFFMSTNLGAVQLLQPFSIVRKPYSTYWQTLINHRFSLSSRTGCGIMELLLSGSQTGDQRRLYHAESEFSHQARFWSVQYALPILFLRG